MGAKEKIQNFADNLYNAYNSFANNRNVLNQNSFVHTSINPSELNAIYKSGLGNRIVQLKVGPALMDTIQFDSIADQEVYDAKLESRIKDAARWMMAFGRGIIVMWEPDEKDLSKPRKKQFDPKHVRIKTFSGYEVSVMDASQDLLDLRYKKPMFYSVNGRQFHWSRVVDFKYVMPVDQELATYNYGGISEFELIDEELKSDAIVRRATPSILEKSATLYYKLKGFKKAMEEKRDESMKAYMGTLEGSRSIYGAGLIDMEDDVTVVNQTLQNLSETDQITLRRIAMVTGIPLPLLIGENVKGLNSSGENEQKSYAATIFQFEADYLKQPINEAMNMLGLGRIQFKDNQMQTPNDKENYNTKRILNAEKLWTMGEDYGKYLEDGGVIKSDPIDKFFPDVKE